MNTLAKRLQFVMSEQGITQQKLAELIGITQQSVNKIVKGDTLEPKKILEIATALGVDVHWLKTGEGGSNSHISTLMSTEPDDEHRFRIDHLDVQAAASLIGIENQDYPEIISSIFFSQNGLLEIVGKKTADNLYLISVPTDSMAPTINKGDLVFVDTSVNYYNTEGIYLFMLNGGLYIKRLMKLPTGIYKAISDNTVYPPFDITDDQFTNATILGKFIRVLPINPRDL